MPREGDENLSYTIENLSYTIENLSYTIENLSYTIENLSYTIESSDYGDRRALLSTADPWRQVSTLK
jgi:hypothetical protein